MEKVWLDKGFGAHAVNWMTPINRANRATLILWDHLAGIPYVGPVIKDGLLRNDPNALQMLILVQGAL